MKARQAPIVASGASPMKVRSSDDKKRLTEAVDEVAPTGRPWAAAVAHAIAARVDATRRAEESGSVIGVSGDGRFAGRDEWGGSRGRRIVSAPRRRSPGTAASRSVGDAMPAA